MKKVAKDLNSRLRKKLGYGTSRNMFFKNVALDLAIQAPKKK